MHCLYFIKPLRLLLKCEEEYAEWKFQIFDGIENKNKCGRTTTFAHMKNFEISSDLMYTNVVLEAE